MRDLVDYELEQELAPAHAPDELWDRVCGGDTQFRARRTHRPWAATAVLTLLTVIAFQVTLNHAGATGHRIADADSCQPSDSAALTAARVVRANHARIASIGFDLPQRPAAASGEDGCGRCHAL